MGDDLRWKRRLPTRIYNYNYKVSENYYKPQTDYIDTNTYIGGRSKKSPPKHQSYAERFVNAPWYGTTKGLPYHDSDTAGPLLKLGDRQYRSNSLLREMKQFEEEGIPLSVRASRRKKRFEDEEEMLGIRRPSSLDSAVKVGSRSSKEIHAQINQKIKDLDEELMKSTRTAAEIEPPTKWNYDLDRPGRRVKHHEESFTSPSTGAKVRRTIHHSEYSSSKPPIAPSLTKNRFSSRGEELFETTPRMRVNSTGDYTALPRSSRRASQGEDDLSLYTNRAPRMREERKHREAQDFSEDITKLVNKMRVKKMEVDPLSAYAQGRHSRSSSIDRTPHRRDSKSSRYVYGIGKI